MFLSQILQVLVIAVLLKVIMKRRFSIIQVILGFDILFPSFFSSDEVLGFGWDGDLVDSTVSMKVLFAGIV